MSTPTGAKPKSREPKLSAAAIILSGQTDPNVLMIRRHENMRFMAGHHAFPGGRIDATEGTAHVEHAPDESEALAIHAVVREVYEETGILCVEGRLPDDEQIKAFRREMLAGAIAFDDVLARHNLKIDARRFEPAGLWITPKWSPIRFHSRYYLHHYEGPSTEELIDEGEISAVEWLHPATARRDWRTGKMKLPPPVAYALQQIASHPYPDVIEPLVRTTHIEPDTPGRIEFRYGISTLPMRTVGIPPATHTNSVAIGEDEIYLIDPGPADATEQRNLKGQLDDMLTLGGRIAAILLTHAHPDHIGAAEFLRQEYNAPIWAHPITDERVSFDIDRHLNDDDVIEIPGDPPWRLRCIYTPGHDPGHLAFLEETSGILACGDMLAQGSSIIISDDHGGDMNDYLASLERLKREKIDLILPAHGMAIDHPEKAIQKYIDHRLEREEKIKAAIESGAVTMRDILASAYDDVPEQVWPLAEQSVRAHLKRLDFNL